MTNDELDAELLRLAGEEREGLRRFLERLAEFDDRRGAEERAYPSLYVYCRARLKLSEGESYRRIHAARTAKRCPLILARVADGSVNLSIVSVLAPLLTPENERELLDRASHKTKREVEFMVCELAPRPVARDAVRFARSIPEAEPARAASASLPIIESKAEPLTCDSIRIHFSASREVFDKLERARSLLRHKFPFGDFGDIVGEALDALLAKQDRDLKERASAPRDAMSGGRRVPQWVKDAVWKRDSGRCAFLATDGTRCGETSWLEFDHVRPYARGGKSDDPANVRLLCRAHNQHAARELFGPRALPPGMGG